MKKIIVTIVALLCISAYSCNSADVSVHSEESKAYTYLVAGLDDASGNTDVLLLLRYREGVLSVVQIPRDTYCDTGLSQNKINQIYAASVSAGMTEQGALSRLRDTVSEVMGCRIDGYIAVTTSGLSRVIDRIGGVEVTLYESLTLDDGERTLSLAEGKHTQQHPPGAGLRRDPGRLPLGVSGALSAGPAALCPGGQSL